MFDEVRSAGGMSFRRRPGHRGVVVLVHGIPGAGAAWNEVADALPAGTEVIIPDLLGFGASPLPSPVTIDELGPNAQARALERLLEEVATERIVLVGHDFGGPVSVLVAARRPDLVSSLVLLAANTFPDTPIPFPLALVNLPWLGGLAGRLLFSRPSLAMMLRQGVGGGPPPDATVYIGHHDQWRAIATIFGGALRGLEELYSPVESALRSLSVPVIVGWGDKDPFFPLAQARRTAEAAGAQLRVIEGAGHFLPHERPHEVASEIEKLIGDHAR